jgi:phage host-nuclease inhibitor protein Gam
VKERLTKVQAIEVAAIEKHYNELIESLKADQKSLQKIIKEKEKIVESERK